VKSTLNDSFKHQGLRKQMILSLSANGITDNKVLEAMSKIPRHIFLDAAFENHAYEDKAFRIGAGQTISAPSTVANQSQLLALNKGDKVLEIGTGSAYQTAVLCEMGAKVFSIERQKELFDKATLMIKKLGYSPRLFYGDGYKGQPAFAPFDRIIITCGAPYIPMDLVDQLKVGGRMIIPVGENSQTMTVITKLDDQRLIKEEFGVYKFVPMLTNKAWRPEK
jgi:protein-L-isoaspartate(D-aspartate) O-methyltransferase